jgi:dTDP-4-amino-4,6-dideoxygalactose transaminase
MGFRPKPHSLSDFRTALSATIGGATCLTASSGRTALYLALKGLHALAPDRRDVIIPAYTCPSLGKVISDLDLQPRLVDIDPATLCYQMDALTLEFGATTLAVILVHPFGLPQPIAPVKELAHAVGAFVIEDAAQALGARQDGLPVGVQGDVGLFSLGPGKPISTGGGGVLCVNNDALLGSMRWAWGISAENHANLSTTLRLGMLSSAFRPFPWWLARRLGAQKVGNSEAAMGFKVRDLSQAQAAVGIELLRKLDAINAVRQRNAEQLNAVLADVAGVWVPSVPESAEAIYLRLPILVEDVDRRERLFSPLNKAGIGVGKMWQYPMTTIFPELAVRDYPGAEFVAAHLLTLPTHHFMSQDDFGRIDTILSNTR